jgi:hypothetical protein
MTTGQENFAALKPLMQEIALQLTKKTKSEWTLRASEPGEYTYFHIDSGNADLFINAASYGNPDRIVIGGITPRGKDRQYIRVYENIDTGNGMRWEEVKFSSITVASNRGAETIAKNIISRFLPNYLKAVRLTLAKIEADNNYAAARRANLEACAVTLNETLRSDYRPINGCDPALEPVTNFHHYFSNGTGKHSGVHVEVNADNKDVDLKIANLTVEQAREVLALLKHITLQRNLA